MFPDYWVEFLESNGLIGKDVEVPEESDLSGLGIDMRFATEDQSRDEAENCYPGVAVFPHGYVPVGLCLVGSGDPYFINTDDGPNGPLYRVYHESSAVEPLDLDNMVDVVLKDYRETIQSND